MKDDDDDDTYREEGVEHVFVVVRTHSPNPLLPLYLRSTYRCRLLLLLPSPHLNPRIRKTGWQSDLLICPGYY